MNDKLYDAVTTLVLKASTSEDAITALNFSIAALNTANALWLLAGIEHDHRLPSSSVAA
jgi:hypothetical protein